MEKKHIERKLPDKEEEKSSKLNITSRESEIEIKIKPCKNL